jgi:hypothetical protein
VNIIELQRQHELNSNSELPDHVAQQLGVKWKSSGESSRFVVLLSSPANSSQGDSPQASESEDGLKTKRLRTKKKAKTAVHVKEKYS